MGRWMSMVWVVSLCLAVGVVSGQDKANLDFPKWVESADENGDGQIDRAEFQTQMTEAFFIVDADKDGYLNLIELRKRVAKIEAHNVETADRDGDGKLSIHEYREAVEKDFDKADRNDDGKLSSAEIEAFVP